MQGEPKRVGFLGEQLDEVVVHVHETVRAGLALAVDLPFDIGRECSGAPTADDRGRKPGRTEFRQCGFQPFQLATVGSAPFRVVQDVLHPTRIGLQAGIVERR
jgi:hypothetical protein